MTDQLAINRIQAVLNHWKPYTDGVPYPVSAADILNVSRATGLAVEVMLAQGWDESHLGTSKGRPQVYHNIYNVGNTDSGANQQMGSWYNGMLVYAHLMVAHYGNTADQLIARDFERTDGKGRYASDPLYVEKFKSLIVTVRNAMATVV